MEQYSTHMDVNESCSKHFNQFSKILFNIIHDDLIIADPAFETVFQKVFELGLTLYPEKSAFRWDEIPF